MEQRLAAAERDDAGAERGEPIDAAQDLGVGTGAE